VSLIEENSCRNRGYSFRRMNRLSTRAWPAGRSVLQSDMMLVRHRMKKVGRRPAQPSARADGLYHPAILTFEHPGGVFEANNRGQFPGARHVVHQASAQEDSEVSGYFHSVREDYATPVSGPTGQAVRLPACVDLATSPVGEDQSRDIVVAGAGYKRTSAVGLNLDS